MATWIAKLQEWWKRTPRADRARGFDQLILELHQAREIERATPRQCQNCVHWKPIVGTFMDGVCSRFPKAETTRAEYGCAEYCIHPRMFPFKDE